MSEDPKLRTLNTIFILAAERKRWIVLKIGTRCFLIWKVWIWIERYVRILLWLILRKLGCVHLLSIYLICEIHTYARTMQLSCIFLNWEICQIFYFLLSPIRISVRDTPLLLPCRKVRVNIKKTVWGFSVCIYMLRMRDRFVLWDQKSVNITFQVSAIINWTSAVKRRFALQVSTATFTCEIFSFALTIFNRVSCFEIKSRILKKVGSQFQIKFVFKVKARPEWSEWVTSNNNIIGCGSSRELRIKIEGSILQYIAWFDPTDRAVCQTL